MILRDCTIKTPVILGGAGSALDVHNGANVTLVLEGANELHGQGNKPAIWVEPGSTLTIEGTGSLSAYAGGGSAGMGSAAIGSAYGTNTSFGDITIQSGTVYAEGSGGGAGIGGGYELGSGSVSGNITINGGWVKAIGGESLADVTGGAGIGSGENADYTGTITISGGVVYAVGGARFSEHRRRRTRRRPKSKWNIYHRRRRQRRHCSAAGHRPCGGLSRLGRHLRQL